MGLLSAVLSGLPAPPLALRNVLRSPRRSLVAILGMGFAIVMVLLQLGFLEAVRVTARVNYEALEFDLLLVSRDFDQFYDPGSFPAECLVQAAAVPGVISASPLWARLDLWRCPTPPPESRPRVLIGSGGTGDVVPIQLRALLVMGIDPGRNPFRGAIGAAVEASSSRLRVPGRVLFNVLSNPDFGTGQVETFRDWELAGRAVEIVGTFRLVRTFGADATVITSLPTYAEGLRVDASRLPVSLGLIRVAEGAGERARGELERRLGREVQVFPRAEILRRESDIWVRQTATGLIFMFGVGVTIVVAAVVIYQVLATDVRSRLPEYATLKAIGYRRGQLSRIVVTQALLYVTFAFIPAVVVAAGLYVVTEWMAQIPMRLTTASLVTVTVLTLLVGVVTGMLMAGKLKRANPADLF